MARKRDLEAVRDALRRGDDALAATLSREALRDDDGDADAWSLLGIALRREDAAASEAALRRAIAGNDANADARFHLGNLLRDQGRLTEAIDAYRMALARRPDHPSLLNNLGLALFDAGAHADAERSYRAALALVPAHRQALGNLVHVLCRAGRYREAGEAADRYVRKHADGPAEFWIDCGIARHARGDLDGAAQAFRNALRQAPKDATALSNLGTVLIDSGDYVDARRALAAAVAATPGDLHALSLLAHCDAHLGRFDDLARAHATIVSRLASDSDCGINPFHALAMPLSPAALRQSARHWAESIRPACALSPGIVRERGNRLRIGYVSSDLREHAVAYLATEVWERHDTARVSTFAYAIGPSDRSPLRERIRAAFGTFHACHDRTPEEVARLVRDDGIDVLVDLNGYTTFARSEIFAARPAPVQVQWLGFLGTMGAPWIDWIVTDREVTPPSMQALFDERFMYLPDCYCPSDTRRPVASDVPSRVACGLPPAGVVFCSFNNPYKLLPAVFDAWMRLLLQVPDAVLWLAPSNAAAAANLRREASLRGVEAHRIVFAPRVPPAQHRARHAHADVYLDTVPYNAGTAANDALFMGVPVVTCPGETMASRVAASQLRAIGLVDLVASDMHAYEQRALTLALDADEREAVKARLAQNRHTHPLFDMARFTEALETAFTNVAG
ncbi:MAG TPA: tetratricopeptide repeat protein [Casimicrobiaceae bacterium]|nr:tetratricopeptide repeat protein [Casimicrobiaceae bacterium]